MKKTLAHEKARRHTPKRIVESHVTWIAAISRYQSCHYRKGRTVEPQDTSLKAYQLLGVKAQREAALWDIRGSRRNRILKTRMKIQKLPGAEWQLNTRGTTENGQSRTESEPRTSDGKGRR